MYVYEESVGLDSLTELETIDGASKSYFKTRDDKIQLMLNFQGDTYMEVIQSRAYDGQSLIGNAGGYVGLFLGVALVQLPSAVVGAIKVGHNIICKY